MSEVGPSAFDPRVQRPETKQAFDRRQPVERVPDWQDLFLAILGNHTNLDPNYRDWQLRRSGFVVLARGATGLTEHLDRAGSGAGLVSPAELGS